MAKNKITTLLMFFILFMFTLCLIRYSNIKDVKLDNWKTEANLPVIEKNKYYDFILLGSSHARIFSRYNNHKRVEKLLNKNFINLSQGGDRGGIINQQTYLRYFYLRGNTAKTIVYLLDPYVFFNNEMDTNIHLYDSEPFRLDFFYQLLINQPKNLSILTSYLSKLLSKDNIPSFPKEYQVQANEDKVSSLSANILDNRIKSLYKDSYDDKSFNNNLNDLIKTIDMAIKNKAKVIIITPTTLLPKQSEDDYFFKAIKIIKNNKFEFYNYSNVIEDSNLYYDTDHLNTQGIITFTEDLLKPIMSNVKK